MFVWSSVHALRQYGPGAVVVHAADIESAIRLAVARMEVQLSEDTVKDLRIELAETEPTVYYGKGVHWNWGSM